jgi:hypothetical protein
MTGVQYVALISRVAVTASNTMDMLFISDGKYSSRLQDVLQWTI